MVKEGPDGGGDLGRDMDVYVSTLSFFVLISRVVPGLFTVLSSFSPSGDTDCVCNIELGGWGKATEKSCHTLRDIFSLISQRVVFVYKLT